MIRGGRNGWRRGRGSRGGACECRHRICECLERRVSVGSRLQFGVVGRGMGTDVEHVQAVLGGPKPGLVEEQLGVERAALEGSASSGGRTRGRRTAEDAHLALRAVELLDWEVAPGEHVLQLPNLLRRSILYLNHLREVGGRASSCRRGPFGQFRSSVKPTASCRPEQSQVNQLSW